MLPEKMSPLCLSVLNPSSEIDVVDIECFLKQAQGERSFKVNLGMSLKVTQNIQKIHFQHLLLTQTER
jgi:glutamate mutase epsilon subunit